MMVEKDKEKNLKKAERLCGKVVEEGAEIVLLPEMFNCPYETELFPDYAEAIPGETTDRLSSLAKELEIYLIGGSIPERAGEKIYNTSPIFGPEGELLGRHRKVHLFEVDVPGKIVFRESDYLSPGDSPTLVETPFLNFGVAICYDLRFPELIRTMSLQGAEALFLPGAFNTTTGPAHWKALLRSRAVDNQIFVVAASPARNKASSYRAYGHSMVVDPWGEVLGEVEAEEASLSVEIDLGRVEEVRKQLPLYRSRRPSLYEL